MNAVLLKKGGVFMGEAIAITSGKGGVGKSSSIISIASMLAEKGYRVLMIDMDLGLKNLDIMMGLQHRVIFDLKDVLEGKCALSKAILKDKKQDNLFLLPACKSVHIETFPKDRLSCVIARLKEEYDYVLLCLEQAHERLMWAYRLSISDMGNNKRSVSIAKHACLMEAEPFIEEVRCSLAEIEFQVQNKIDIQNIRLNMGRSIVFSDVYGDGFLVDWLIQRQIKKMIKAVENTYGEVERLRGKV